MELVVVVAGAFDHVAGHGGFSVSGFEGIELVVIAFDHVGGFHAPVCAQVGRQDVAGQFGLQHAVDSSCVAGLGNTDDAVLRADHVLQQYAEERVLGLECL